MGRQEGSGRRARRDSRGTARVPAARIARLALAAGLAWLPLAATAFDLGLSVASWSFSRPVSEARADEGREIARGLYARAGGILGAATRLELEAYAIGELSPLPLRDLYCGAEATIPLLGSGEKNYFNAFASLGFMQGLRLDGGAAPAGRYLSLRVSPLAIGNPSYGRRSRLFSVGALYELGSGEVSLTWSALAFDFF